MTESIQMIAQVASAALISSIWQGCVLAAMIWLCLKLAPRTTAGVRSVIWTAVFIATALLPVVSIFLSNSSSSALLAAIHPTGPAILLDSRWALGIAAFWGIFAAVRLLVLASNAFKTSALWRRSTPIALTPSLELILSQPGLRHPAMCTSTEIDQPCVIGFFAPRILVPGWLLATATPAELEQIVLHESAHLRRFDDWTNLVQKLLAACFPFSPALLWIERRLCAEREIACDESVVRTTNSPREYANCLTNLAEQRLSRRSMVAPLSLGAWERRSQLAGRIESILLGSAKLGPAKTRALALAFMAVTVGSAIKLGGTAQLVSFVAQPDQPLAQSGGEGISGTHYQNVVFHPQSSTALENPLRYKDVQPQTDPAKQPIRKPVTLKHSLRHAPSPADGVESIVIVTRWQNSSGVQMTRIEQVVRISSLPAAQQAGWFVVQL